jgi:predicted lipid-binding transport protein (Tim44 family)
MKKQLTFLLVMLALVISACQPQSTPPSPAAPATPQASSAAPSEAPTASPEPEQPVATESPATTEMVGPAAPPGCTVVSQQTSPTEESPFPAISDQDWVQGPPDAYVSIIEYGDFQ